MTKLREWMVGATLAGLWACGGGPEQSTVDQFFRAARTNDQSTLAAMSAVAPPVEVESWEVAEVSSRSTEPFALPGLRERFEAAEKEREAAREVRQEYLAENQDALEEIIPKLQEDPEFQFRGRLGEIQEEWLRLVEERKEKEGAYQDLRRAVEAETRLTTKSMMSQVAVEELDGDVAVTEMLLMLKPRDGDVELPYRVTLHKYDLSGPQSDRIEPSRWVIVDIEGTTPEARRAASSPFEGRREPAVESAAATEPSPAVESVAATEPSGAGEAAAESEPPARRERRAARRELQGPATVQILTPETKVEGNEVISTIRARNVSDGWLTRFTVTEHWYDEQGNAMRGGSHTHQGRFMPGEVIELELRTAQNPNFYQNQFEFSHANGDVRATVVGSFPESSEP